MVCCSASIWNLLRTLKFTRGAGGLFLGLAVSLYIVLPLLVIFMDVLLNPATGYNPTAFWNSDTCASNSGVR